ncbi:hypothetical protein [Actinoalloteichus sp. GBA129-24]|uniref:hypothetical protein n=1 Tax=Actinoalloteichus sp. GBA129-24 TaxID=1612551 RepID=UPI00095050DF|nr:hypothetical protein [Actinoalloteichus sp. GBA129-24]APU20936.1 hypothetical protein UA75_14630 [Actinoalloteichus sp. GBA129-24]APU24185.1 hypothetical protein UA75_31110 [Actinoalloteichus sp. GBA129-24]
MSRRRLLALPALLLLAACTAEADEPAPLPSSPVSTVDAAPRTYPTDGGTLLAVESDWRPHLEGIDNPARAEACYDEGWTEPRCGRYLAGVVQDVRSVTDMAAQAEWPSMTTAASNLFASYEEYEEIGCHEAESADCTRLRTEVLTGPSLVLLGYEVDLAG